MLYSVAGSTVVDYTERGQVGGAVQCSALPSPVMIQVTLVRC
jgi:hypothetical protein